SEFSGDLGLGFVRFGGGSSARLSRTPLPLEDEWLQPGRRPVVAELFWRTHSRTTMLSLRRKRSEVSLTNNADRAFEAGQWRRAADSTAGSSTATRIICRSG